MKILLYEPTAGGHRDTMLHYTYDGIISLGLDTVVVRRNFDYKCEWSELQQYAIENKCNAIHILTFDGMPKRWLKELLRNPLILTRRRKVPIYATYYLYNNFSHSIKGLGLKLLCRIGMLDRFFLPAEVFPHNVPHVTFSDPWRQSEFKLYSKSEARRFLGIHDDKTVILVFGDLSERKGTPAIIDAWLNSRVRDGVLLLVGKGLPAMCVRKINDRPDVVYNSGYVPEEEVSYYFSAATVVASAYPKDFVVSSGNFIRACAAGVPFLASSHGWVGEKIQQYGCGWLAESGDLNELTRAFEYLQTNPARAEANRRGKLGQKLAEGHEWGQYCKQLKILYDKIS